MAALLNLSRTPCGPTDRDLLGQSHAEHVRSELKRCPVFTPTPTVTAPTLARAARVGAVFVKDDSTRMGLGSFKALGGAYAVIDLARSRPGLTVTCASAGNHGLSVAAGARMAGVRAVIWLSDRVSADFARRLTEQGAEVRRAGPDYADSLAAANAAAEQDGWELVADGSWPGYTDIPLQIMRGYTVTVAEAADSLDIPATHVFVQAGVGGLAAAVTGYLRDRWGEAPTIVVVEPDNAACLFTSAGAGRPTRVAEGRTTLGRLDCGEPSLVAWTVLDRLADAFVTVTDAAAAGAVVSAAGDGMALSACGAAGVAGLLTCADDPGLRAAIGLDTESRVLLFGTEGPEGGAR